MERGPEVGVITIRDSLLSRKLAGAWCGKTDGEEKKSCEVEALQLSSARETGETPNPNRICRWLTLIWSLTCLSLSFLICKMKAILLYSIKWDLASTVFSKCSCHVFFTFISSSIYHHYHHHYHHHHVTAAPDEAPGSHVSTSYVLTHSILTTAFYDIGSVTVPILQMRKLRYMK